MLGFGYPLSLGVAGGGGASLAQVQGRILLFILAGLGITYQLLPAEGLSLILAGSLLSIALNPLAFWAVDRINAKVRANPRLYHRLEEARNAPLLALQAELESVHQQQIARSRARKRFTPTNWSASSRSFPT